MLLYALFHARFYCASGDIADVLKRLVSHALAAPAEAAALFLTAIDAGGACLWSPDPVDDGSFLADMALAARREALARASPRAEEEEERWARDNPHSAFLPELAAVRQGAARRVQAAWRASGAYARWRAARVRAAVPRIVGVLAGKRAAEERGEPPRARA